MSFSPVTASVTACLVSVLLGSPPDRSDAREYRGPTRVQAVPAPPREAPPISEGPADEIVEAPPEDDYDPTRHGPQALAARHWTIGGIVLLATGTVLGAGSLAVGLSDPCASAAGNSCQDAARKRATWTMATPAIVMLGAGAAMLTVGLVKRSRLKLSVHAGRLVGATLSARFR